MPFLNAFLVPFPVCRTTTFCTKRSAPFVVQNRPSQRYTLCMTISTPNDLLVVGAGNLGRRVAYQWRQKHPLSNIIAETQGVSSHPHLATLGITPTLAGTSTHQYPNVVYCVPPRSDDDYALDVRNATKRIQTGGRFVFTSSASVHGTAEVVSEATPVVEDDMARRRKLLDAEDVVRQFGDGYVLRFSGLYSLDHGPHWYWLTKSFKDVHVNPDDSVNMIHYEDAAAAVVALLALEKAPKQKVFLACAEDGTTIIDLFTSAQLHPLYADTRLPTFSGGANIKKKYNNDLTRRTLMWQPRWPTMVQFMKHAAEQEQRKRNQPPPS